ncbi:acyl carrier protein [Streptomyces sp. NPDC047917]|uniref:acyl carrier protein n=1 Tax=Streptomyces sp. NPDC047917 TaxID=3365491 RepID=UPI0037203A65
MITIDQVRGLLCRPEIVPGTEALGDDTPITLDSLALVWFQHVLEEEHGISIDPYGADLDHFDSVRGIHTYLRSVGAVTTTAHRKGGTDAD